MTQVDADSALLQGAWPYVHAVCKNIVNNQWFECAISLVIVANSVLSLGINRHLQPLKPVIRTQQAYEFQRMRAVCFQNVQIRE